jgi:hypothetical protein
MDPVCVDQAINVLFAFCTGNDHRIVNGSLRFKDDFPTVFITGSGGGKSPMIIQMFLEGIIKQVKEIIDCIPGGLSSFVTAGASYPGWLTAVHWHHFCIRRWAQSCARLLSPKESKFTPLEARTIRPLGPQNIILEPKANDDLRPNILSHRLGPKVMEIRAVCANDQVHD